MKMLVNPVKSRFIRSWTYCVQTISQEKYQTKRTDCASYQNAEHPWMHRHPSIMNDPVINLASSLHHHMVIRYHGTLPPWHLPRLHMWKLPASAPKYNNWETTLAVEHKYVLYSDVQVCMGVFVYLCIRVVRAKMDGLTPNIDQRRFL